MARKLKGGAIQANTVTEVEIASSVINNINVAYAQANSAYAQANAAYNQANTGSSSGGFSKSFLLGGL
jgi:hypothetical protein